ncbi:hypothetical protein DEO72_LG10g4257 [Vigna unguiculata]|uniref:Uncharacterized protein n=1 Tax=Vigna unguiculata TaxID=3917 RepID=A0A4D6NH51_VIGUN|nr:hypothetical protein DEO72_LG10g4257 [Vigna unguiculata]
MVKEYLKIDDGFDDDRCVLRVKRREREEEEDGHARSMSEWRKEVPQMREA